MRKPGMAGVSWAGRGQSAGFAPATENAAGNNLPGITGPPDQPFRLGPAVQNVAGGQLGGKGDGSVGPDPRAAKMQPYPQSSWTDSWSEGQTGSPGGPGLRPLPYGGYGNFIGRGFANQTGIYGTPDVTSRQTWWRGGIQGFSDKLTVKDRHAYWDTGNQRTGTSFSAAGAPPSTYNNPMEEPPRPDLRTVNRTVSYQKGTDATRNQDDLSRPYTRATGTRGFVGEQGSGWAPIYGGVPGMYQPYGSRGGVPFPIVSPSDFGQPGDGPHLVFSGPPHGLHSQTPWKGGAQIISRFMSTPQTRPVRFDRPANSPQAGQSYSQTVLPQGASPVRPGGGRAGFQGRQTAPGLTFPLGRGWGGQIKTNQTGQNWLFNRGSAQ